MVTSTINIGSSSLVFNDAIFELLDVNSNVMGRVALVFIGQLEVL
jgi:hypothetical protein